MLMLYLVIMASIKINTESNVNVVLSDHGINKNQYWITITCIV